MIRVMQNTYLPPKPQLRLHIHARQLVALVSLATILVLGLPVTAAYADHSPSHFEDWLGERSCSSPRVIQLHSYATGDVVHRKYFGLGEESFEQRSWSGGWAHRYSTYSVVIRWMPAGLIHGWGASVSSESGATCTL